MNQPEHFVLWAVCRDMNPNGTIGPEYYGLKCETCHREVEPDHPGAEEILSWHEYRSAYPAAPVVPERHLQGL